MQQSSRKRGSLSLTFSDHNVSARISQCDPRRRGTTEAVHEPLLLILTWRRLGCETELTGIDMAGGDGIDDHGRRSIEQDANSVARADHRRHDRRLQCE